MKTNQELWNIARESAAKILLEIDAGGGETLNGLVRLETLARLTGATVNLLKQRALGTAHERDTD